VGADLGDAAGLEHDDAVGGPDGGQAVGDDQGGAALAGPGHGRRDLALAGRVQVGDGLVHDQDGGVLEQGPGDGDALALAARQAGPELTGDAGVAVGQAGDELVGQGGPGGRLDLGVAGVGPAQAASFGALPALIGRERLPAANSARWSASTTLTVAGPAVAGVLVATVGPAPALWLDSASYLVSAGLLVSIRRSFQRRNDPVGEAPPDRARIRQDIADGLRFLWHHPLVRPLTLTGFGNSLTGGAVIGLLVVYGVQALGLSPTDGRLALLYTAGAAGSLAASLLLLWLGRRIGPTRVTLAALAVSLAALTALALVSSLPAALALLLVWQGTYMLVIVNGITLRQQVIPDHLQGRVNVTARMIAWGGTPFGAARGGVIAQLAGIRVAYLVMAAGVAASTALGWSSPALRRRLGPA
jgi:Transmembrane secretion effector